ncbi:MAG: hypothetical protein LC646_03735 [Xanthomonadaceae bacterium]|nr:hypothetical protein [Xanthomonadaceae bacterium]
MLTLVAIGLLYLALVLGLLWALRRKRARERVVRATPVSATRSEVDRLDYLKRSGLYWGVTIQTRKDRPSCSQVQELHGQAFALDYAPRLPLAGCELDCHCHYLPLLEHRDDKVRRIHHDRRSILRYEPDKKNRRRLPTRRK